MKAGMSKSINGKFPNTFRVILALVEVSDRQFLFEET
jgi:hypothetical protein